MSIIVNPGRIRQFGETEGSIFCLVTNPELAESLKIDESASYSDYRTVLLSAGESFDDLLRDGTIPENSHTLVISPYRFFASPDSELLGPRRKLLGMACNSTPTTPEVIRHFLGVVERTSPTEQDAFSEKFFELAESTDHLVYVDERHGTRAVLDHFDDSLVWNQQAGSLEWGSQQILPSGEISVLPAQILDFDENLYLPLEGEIAIRGYPILHSGTPSFTRKDQARLQARFAQLHTEAVVARVTKGTIQDLRPFRKEGHDIADLFNTMFEVDSRYTLVWEIGHALNTSLDLLPGNHAMNEVYGGTDGCLHWGFGLTPYTQYHLDVVAPDTTVYTESGEVVLGNKGGGPQARIAGAA